METFSRNQRTRRGHRDELTIITLDTDSRSVVKMRFSRKIARLNDRSGINLPQHFSLQNLKSLHFHTFVLN
jgi:hypothetical protein